VINKTKKKKAVGYGVFATNYLKGKEIREIGWKWARN